MDDRPCCKAHFLILTTVFLLAFQHLSYGASKEAKKPAESHTEFVVCGATLNSPDEFQAFKEQLSLEGGFHFVELTEQAPGRKSFEREKWFNSSCQNKKVQCDVLIVSGHFGGHFFGNNQKHDLYLETMEDASCKNSCSNILHRPLETFLFGCNTLAGKEDDGRDRQAYRNLLVGEDLIPEDQADRIVAARYGPWGGAWGDRMIRSFKGVENIYGYSSRSPLGHKNKRHVVSYIQKIQKTYGSYKNFLRTLKNRREELNSQSSSKVVDNHHFFQVFSGQKVSQATGRRQEDEYYRNSCTIKDQNRTVKERLGLIHDVLGKSNHSEDADRLKYFLIISSFIQKNISMSDQIQFQRQLERFDSLSGAKKQFYDGFSKTQSPPLIIDLAILGYTFGWLTQDEAASRIKLALNGFQSGKRKSKYSKYLSCIAGKSYPDLGRFFSYRDVASASDAYKAEVIACLRMRDRQSHDFYLKRYANLELNQRQKFLMKINMYKLQSLIVPNEQQIKRLIAKYEYHEKEIPKNCYHELGQIVQIFSNLPNTPRVLLRFYDELLRDPNRNQCDYNVRKLRNR